MMKNAKLLCEYRGGSHAYGLNTPASDIDIRGCYITTEPTKILGMLDGRSGLGAVQVTQDNIDDSVYTEVRHLLKLFSTGNSNALEMLFNENWQMITPEFKAIQANRHYLVDPKQVYRSTRGYAQSEFELALGNRTGKLGGKRQEQVSKYGFSPKNFVNLFRLLTVARLFFIQGEYHLCLKEAQPFIHAMLYEIKTAPERSTRPGLINKYNELLNKFEEAWVSHGEDICNRFRYDQEVATKLALDIYYPVLRDKVEGPPKSFIQRIFRK